ncbi:unnamed protein product [Ectocarpus sp. 8 AP-2014]
MAEAKALSAPSPFKSDKGRKRWFPLESNPDVMNKYIAKMGWPAGAYSFTDVYSTEDWALAMVPQPVLGVVMLFPIKESTEKHREEEAARVRESTESLNPKLYFMKQTVGNACGTVGLLHCALNASISKGITLDKECFLHRFWEKTRQLSPAQIAQALHDEDELEEVHEEAAQEGQSDQIAREEKINTHFVCLTEMDGTLYELDGRKEGPVPHGSTSPATLLQDACAVVKQFMDRDPGELRQAPRRGFTIVALAPAATDDA